MVLRLFSLPGAAEPVFSGRRDLVGAQAASLYRAEKIARGLGTMCLVRNRDDRSFTSLKSPSHWPHQLRNTAPDAFEIISSHHLTRIILSS
jgi:hypothetical protein